MQSDCKSWHLQSMLMSTYCQVEKDSAYIKAVESAGAKVESIIKVNNAIDIYEEYFKYE